MAKDWEKLKTEIEAGRVKVDSARSELLALQKQLSFEFDGSVVAELSIGKAGATVIVHQARFGTGTAQALGNWLLEVAANAE